MDLLLAILLCSAQAGAQTFPTAAPMPAPAVPLMPRIGLPSDAFAPTPLLSPSALTPALATPSLRPLAAPRVEGARPVQAFPAAGPAAGEALPNVETGDLVFLDLECGALCEAMAEVTTEQFGVQGPRLTHVGIVEMSDGVPFVWEAWPGKGVARVPLRLFLSRVKGGESQAGGFYLGRLQDGYRGLGTDAVARIRELEGLPYDSSFSWGSPGMYCAKLVSAAFGDASLFQPRPMYFGREGSRARETWRAYFAARGMAVPDGQPGVSPLGLFLEGSRRLFRPSPAR